MHVVTRDFTSCCCEPYQFFVLTNCGYGEGIPVKNSWPWVPSLRSSSLVDHFNELTEESCYNGEQQQAAVFITVSGLPAGLLLQSINGYLIIDNFSTEYQDKGHIKNHTYFQ